MRPYFLVCFFYLVFLPQVAEANWRHRVSGYISSFFTKKPYVPAIKQPYSLTTPHSAPTISLKGKSDLYKKDEYESNWDAFSSVPDILKRNNQNNSRDTKNSSNPSHYRAGPWKENSSLAK